MQQAEINSALNKKLTTLANVLPFYIEGNVYRPVEGKAYMRTNLIMSPPAASAIGNGIFARQRGIYVADIFWPQNLQTQKALDTYAETVRRLFFPTHNRGLNITEGSTVVYVDRMPSIVIPQPAEPYIRRTVQVFFQVEDAPA